MLHYHIPIYGILYLSDTNNQTPHNLYKVFCSTELNIGKEVSYSSQWLC